MKDTVENKVSWFPSSVIHSALLHFRPSIWLKSLWLFFIVICHFIYSGRKAVLTVNLIKTTSPVSIYVVVPVRVCCLEKKYLITDIFLKLECGSQAILCPHLSSSVNGCASRLWNPFVGFSCVISLLPSKVFISFLFFCDWLTLPMYLPRQSGVSPHSLTALQRQIQWGIFGTFTLGVCKRDKAVFASPAAPAWNKCWLGWVGEMHQQTAEENSSAGGRKNSANLKNMFLFADI